MLGALAWFAIGNGRGIGEPRWILVALTAFIAALPPVTRVIHRALERVRDPSRRARCLTGLSLALISAAYFALTAFNQDRDLFPKTHDDCSYVIGMQLLAHGRLWMPALPNADFFESFYILTSPAYCSKYFSGTALLYVPTVWLRLPTWVLPVLAAGACVGLTYRIVTELLDGTAGWLAAMVMVSLSWLRMLSVLVMSNVPMLLMALLLFMAWLKWRDSRKLRWALAMGIFAGWGAITRPIDAIVVTLPIAVAVAQQLWRGGVSVAATPASRSRRSRDSGPEETIEPDSTLRVERDAGVAATSIESREQPPVVQGERRGRGGSRWRFAFATIAIAFAGAAPFLTLQILFNVGVTGRATQTPYGYYIDRYQPNTTYGFHAIDPDATVRSSLPQKREYYEKFVQPYIEAHRPANVLRTWTVGDPPKIPEGFLGMIVSVSLPCRLLLLLVPVGLLGLRDWRRTVLFAWLPLFVAFYFFSTFFIEHYVVLIAPAMILCVLMGGRVITSTFPRWQQPIGAVFAAVLITIGLTNLWEINRLVATPETRISDETFPSPMLRYVNRDLPARTDLQKPALVLFTYGGSFVEEPVYNTGVAWPFDAEILRAHDLGPRNPELFATLARTQPARTVYRFDGRRTLQGLDPLIRLGTVGELVGK